MTSNSDGKENGGSYPPSKKIQVLFLASEWGSSKGGLSTINRELAINVAKYSEVDVSYFVPQCNDRDRKAARDNKIKIVEATKIPGLDELQWLCFLPHDFHIDVVIGHGVKLGPQASGIRTSHQCKWVQVVHTSPEELAMHKDYPNPLLSGEKKHATEVELCKMADFVVPIGPKLNEAFRSYLGLKDEIVFNFTPGIFREFSDVQQDSDRTGKFRVLLFGRGDAEDFNLKGCDIAAKAVSLSNTHLIFVGAPEEKLQEVKNRFLECDIHPNNLTVRSFLRNREDIKDLLREADVAIMPSRTEGFGLTGLEALSAGLPILVSKNSGFAEALSKVPFGPFFVVDSDNPEVWAKAIKNVMDRKRTTRLVESEALRTSYEKEYSWEKQSEELIGKMITMVRGMQSVYFLNI